MSTGIRWLIGLGLAQVVGYVAVALYLLVRIRPQPIVVPWIRAAENPAWAGSRQVEIKSPAG